MKTDSNNHGKEKMNNRDSRALQGGINIVKYHTGARSAGLKASL